jgi:hypothetical protein
MRTAEARGTSRGYVLLRHGNRQIIARPSESGTIRNIANAVSYDPVGSISLKKEHL